MDYYDTILTQRGASEAFQVAADDARKLREQIKKFFDFVEFDHKVISQIKELMKEEEDGNEKQGSQNEANTF